jgi:hypothetical protein
VWITSSEEDFDTGLKIRIDSPQKDNFNNLILVIDIPSLCDNLISKGIG